MACHNIFLTVLVDSASHCRASRSQCGPRERHHSSSAVFRSLPALDGAEPGTTLSSRTQPASAQGEEYDYGCWGNFCLQVALCCIPHSAGRINIVSVSTDWFMIPCVNFRINAIVTN